MSHTLLDTTQAALAIAAAIDSTFPPSFAEKLQSFNAALAFIEQEHDVSLDSFRELLGAIEGDFDDEDEVDGARPAEVLSAPFLRADDSAPIPPEVRNEIAQRAAHLTQTTGTLH